MIELNSPLKDERGWSFYKLSKAANIPQSTLSNLFNRENSPTISTLTALCDAFGISIAQFFSDVADSTLTDEQNELLKNWARLSKPQQETIRVYMKGLLQEPL